MVGNLPDDFLRPGDVSSRSTIIHPSQQEMADRELAMHLQQQQQWAAAHQHFTQSYAGQLVVTVVEVSCMSILMGTAMSSILIIDI